MPTDKNIDWLRVAHRFAVLLRELRGDGDVEADHATERRRGAELNQTATDVARRAVGCRRPNPCDCAVCTQED